MARELIFADSFDHYTTEAQLQSKWTGFTAGTRPTIQAIGRFSTNGLGSDNVDHGIYRALGRQCSTLIAGGAYTQHNYWPGTGSTIYRFQDSVAGSFQVELRTDSLGRFLVTRNGTTIATSTKEHPTGVSHFIEFGATIHNSAGAVAVLVNGFEVLNDTGLDTQATGNAFVDLFTLVGNANFGSSNWYFDDHYVCDASTGSSHDDFLGDVRVSYLAPNGNGNSSQWDGSDGNSTDNYLLVDEATPDGNTTYVESGDTGDKDTYAFADLGVTAGTVYGVQVIERANKQDAGTRNLTLVARHSGSETDSTPEALSTSDTWVRHVYETKPGGGAWSISDVNGAEFGQKVA